jgi:putative ABC transport system permease protein
MDWTAKKSTFTQVTANFKILGCDADVDNSLLKQRCPHRDYFVTFVSLAVVVCGHPESVVARFMLRPLDADSRLGSKRSFDHRLRARRDLFVGPIGYTVHGISRMFEFARKELFALIGLLEIRRRKFQFALITLVVVLISYLVLMINGLGVGLNESAGSALKNFDADALAYSDRSGTSVIRSELSQEQIDAIASVPGVTASAPLGYIAVNYASESGTIESAAFLGYDPGTIAEPPVTDGRALSQNDATGMLADKLFLKASGFSIGDEVKVSLRLSEQIFTIVGEIDQGSFFFQPAVYILRTTWQEMKYGSQADPPVASVVLLQGNNLAGVTGEGFEIVDKSTAFANIEGVSGQQATVVSLRVFGYIIGAMVIGVFFYVLTLQKVPQIGVLKAIGASNGFVFRQILLQVITLSIIGLLVSVPLAWLTYKGLQRLPDAVPIAFTTSTYVTTCLALLATAIIGALFSGRQVIKTDPIIALGQQQ